MVQKEHMKQMVDLIKVKLAEYNGKGIISKRNNIIIDQIATKYLGDLSK